MKMDLLLHVIPQSSPQGRTVADFLVKPEEVRLEDYDLPVVPNIGDVVSFNGNDYSVFKRVFEISYSTSDTKVVIHLNSCVKR
jgi:hypothetical protein